jgi:hypothetical protein
MDNRRSPGRMGHQDGQRMHKRPRSVRAPETCPKVNSSHYDFYGDRVRHSYSEILRSFPNRRTRFRIRLLSCMEMGCSWCPDCIKYCRLNRYPTRDWQKGGAHNLIHNRTHLRPWACSRRHVQDLQNLKFPHHWRYLGSFPGIRDVQRCRN